MPAKGVKVKKGDKVEARWKGSRFYFPATIVEASGDNYEVLFNDGSSASVKSNEIKTIDSPAEPLTRGRNRSRSSSAGRATRSSSRSPSRKSPSRELKKTTTTKTKTTKTKSLKNNLSDDNVTSKRSYTRRSANAKKDVSAEAESRSSGEDVAPVKSLRSAPVKSSSSYANSTKQEASYSVVLEDFRKSENTVNLRTSARIAALQATKAVTSTSFSDRPNDEDRYTRKALESKSLGLPKELVDGESEEESDEEPPAKPQKKFSFLSCFFALVKVFSLPLSLLFFALACTQKLCSIYDIPPAYARWRDFTNEVTYPLLVCTGFHLLLCILSKIPVGRLVTEYGYVPKEKPQKKYRLNGFYLLLLSIMVFGVLLYFDFYATWIGKKVKHLVISSLIYTTFWSVVIHLRGALKKHDDTEEKPFHRCAFIGDFYFGREFNPWLFGIEDVKTRFIQFGLIGLVLLDLSIMSRFVVEKTPFSLPPVLVASMHILFVLEFFWREECMLSSATYLEDGVGFGFIMGIGSLIPFSFALQTIFLMNHPTKASHLPHWCSAVIVALFLCGLYIYDSSVRLKHNFRKAPFSPSMSKVVSIPTSKKKRLILSGLWGIVRHPNYLGLLIMVIACSLPCGFTHVLPYTPLLFFIVLLGLRSIKQDRKCQEKYGPAWHNYISKVRSRMIPYIF